MIFVEETRHWSSPHQYHIYSQTDTKRCFVQGLVRIEGNMDAEKYRAILSEIGSRVFWISGGGECLQFIKTTQSIPPRKHRSGFGETVKVLEWPSQSLDLDPRVSLERPENGCARHSPSNLKTSRRCAKLVESFPRWPEAVIAAKSALNQVLSEGSAYLHNGIFQTFIKNKLT